MSNQIWKSHSIPGIEISNLGNTRGDVQVYTDHSGFKAFHNPSTGHGVKWLHYEVAKLFLPKPEIILPENTRLKAVHRFNPIGNCAAWNLAWAVDVSYGSKPVKGALYGYHYRNPRTWKKHEINLVRDPQSGEIIGEVQ